MRFLSEGIIGIINNVLKNKKEIIKIKEIKVFKRNHGF